MLTTFKINIDNINEEQLGNKIEHLYHITAQRELAQTILSCYDAESEYFDGIKMQETLFPQVSQTNIFLSHSYNDVGMALAIKNTIESRCKNTKVFIDSLYWGSVYKAQEYIERRFDCDTSSILKHLHIMITTAIAQMIQSSKYFLFLESENSISDRRDGATFVNNSKPNLYRRLIQQSNKKTKITQSPWIYYELQIATMFKDSYKQKLMESGLENYKIESMQNAMKCFFDINDTIDRIQEIKLEDFIERL